MENVIKNAVVIGAGSMGAGIAAHLANSGANVTLLDIPAKEGDRDAISKGGVARQLKSHGFMRPEFADRVATGNTEDNLDVVANADWVIEAIIENPQIKRDLYNNLAKHAGPDTIITSNTSTIPLENLTSEMSEDRKKNFAIIHFFNPPRVMKLVELVSGKDTDPQVAEKLRRACEQQLGKIVLDCRDTPGFIANRVGNFWMAAGVHSAINNGVRYEDADLAFGRPFGVPRTGIFGLFDYIGLQLVPAIWKSLETALPETDLYHQYPMSNDETIKGLLERGWTGRTGESGFYKGRTEVLNPEDFTYRPRQNSDDPALAEKDALSIMKTDSPVGRFAKDTFLLSLKYDLEVASEIADTVEDIDIAMVTGYNWKRGPFALADSIGLDWIAENLSHPLLDAAIKVGGFYPSATETLSTTGEAVSRRNREGVVTLREATKDAKVVFENEGARIHLRNDGIAIFQFVTPMNSCTSEAIAAFGELAENGQSWGVKAVVIGNDEQRAFSAGANLPLLAQLTSNGETEKVAQLLREGRENFSKLRTAPFPVVAAARGLALGGGAELFLHCDAHAVAAETPLGFPERNVGLYPGWGGTIRVLDIALKAGAEDPHRTAFDLIMAAKPLPTAFDAQAYGLLTPNDRILLSADHVLGEAIELATSLIEGYTAPAESTLRYANYGVAELTRDWQGEGVSPTDTRIAEALAAVYCNDDTQGAEVSESEMGQRETAGAVEVLTHQENIDRVAHMAKTRKPLKN